jgi:hypothetical protein
MTEIDGEKVAHYRAETLVADVGVLADGRRAELEEYMATTRGRGRDQAKHFQPSDHAHAAHQADSTRHPAEQGVKEDRKGGKHTEQGRPVNEAPKSPRKNG